MALADKLQLKGDRMCVYGMPDDVDLGGIQVTENALDPVLLFVTDEADLDRNKGAVVDAAREDRLAWLAYPKGGQLGTDLDRDTVIDAIDKRKVRPARQVSIDEVWTAIRLRPAQR